MRIGQHSPVESVDRHASIIAELMLSVAELKRQGSLRPTWLDLTSLLANGWTEWAYGAGLRALRHDGIVYLEGLVNADTATGQIVMTLPVGYRPSADRIYSCPAAGGYQEMRLLTTGALDLGDTGSTALGDAEWISLTPIIFPIF